MSREIDERIVAMYFDNKNFEKNAEQTLKTLEELKKSTNMEGVGKGFEAFEEAAKKLNLSKLNEDVKKVKTSFEGLGNVLKKSLNVAMGPLNSMKGLFNELNNYVTKVAGINIAGKIVGGVENALRSLTVAPISAGWNQYENTMDSVKTIMSSTGESIDTVKAKLGEMTEYANQTIYSLNDMTSNLGKFTNNGVKLEDATNAMIGLANATADAGQGAAQASMAMYNVSQAIGVGKMLTIDWKSLENANIATQKLKKTFIESAYAAGELTRKEKGLNEAGEMTYQYFTKAEKKGEEAEVTVENFRETLSKGWLTKDAMMSTFAVYSGQLSVKEIAALGFSEAEAERLYQIGQEAKAAATEVRTFSKMMDALKESVQSGWAASFEYIFGDMQEGTNLWTSINDKIDGILSKSSENRNNILIAWRGMMKDENGQLRKIQDVYESRRKELESKYNMGMISATEYEGRLKTLEAQLGDKRLWTDYRQVVIDTFMDMFDVVQNVAGTIKGAFTDVFGSVDADVLKRLSQGFRELTDNIKYWLGDSKDAESRISKIRKALTGVFAFLKARMTVMKSLLQMLWSIAKPLIDPLLNLFAKFGGWLEDFGKAKNLGEIIKTLGDKFGSLWDKLTKLGWQGVFKKIGDWISDLWSKIAGGISEWLNENGLDSVVQWFVELGDKIKYGFQAAKLKIDELGITDFFVSLWEDISGWFSNGGPKDVVDWFVELGDNIKYGFLEASSVVDELGITDFFISLWDGISEWFNNGGVNDVADWFVEIGDNIKYGFLEVASVVDELGITDFFVSLWNDITEWFDGDVLGTLTDGLVALGDDIKYGFLEVLSKFDELGITDFFVSAWEEVCGWFDGDVLGTVTGWLTELGDNIKYGFLSVQSTIEELGITDFFASLWGSITGWFDNGGVSGIVDWFIELGDDIKYGFEEILLKLEEFGVMSFPEADETTSPIASFLSGVWNGIKDIWDRIVNWNGWPAIGKFLSDIWGWIIDLFKGDESSIAGAENAPKKAENAEQLASSLTETLESFQKISGQSDESLKKLGSGKGLFETVGEFFGKIFSSLGEAVMSIGSVPEAQAILQTISGIVEIIGRVVQTVVDWLGRITGTDRNGNTSTVIDYVIPALGAVIAIALEVYKYKKASNLARIAEAGGLMSNIGGEFLKIAGGIVLLAVAVRYLGAIPRDDLIQGAYAVGSIMIGVIVAITALKNLMEAIPKKNPETSGERIAKHAITAVTIAGVIAEAMALLPAILEKLEGFDDSVNGDAILKTFEGLTMMISGIILSIAIFNKLGGSSGTSIAATAKSALALVAGIGIVLIGFDAIIGTILGATEIAGSQYTDDHVKRIQAGGRVMAAMGEAIGGFLGAIGGGLAGGFSAAQGNKLAEGTKTASEILSDVNLEDMQHMADVVSVLGDIQDNLPDYDNIFDKWINGDKLGQLGDNVGRLGEGLGKMVTAINPADLDPGNDVERIKTYVRLLSSFSSVLNVLYDTVVRASMYTGSFDADYISNMINTALPYYKEAAIQLGDAIQAGLNGNEADVALSFSFDPTGIITVICESLEQEGKPKIAKAVSAMIQFGLDQYSSVDEFGNTAIHSTGQINDSLTKLFELMTQNGSQANLSGVLTGFLGDLGNENTLNSLLGQYDSSFGTIGSMLSEKISDNMSLDLGKWLDVDENGTIPALADIEEKWNAAVSQMEDSGDLNLELGITPVLIMDETFQNQVDALKATINSQVPIAVNGSVNIGEQAIPIDDSAIVNKLQLLSTQLEINRVSNAQALNAVTASLGMRITNLGNDIASMKLYLDTGALVGGIIGAVDSQLYQRGWYGSMTGIT